MEIYIVYEYDEPTNKIAGVYKDKEKAEEKQKELPTYRYIITEELKKYLKKVYIINPSADFNEAPATQIKNMPYDLMTLYVKGR